MKNLTIKSKLTVLRLVMGVSILAFRHDGDGFFYAGGDGEWIPGAMLERNKSEKLCRI
jgi:hypothetical protein